MIQQSYSFGNNIYIYLKKLFPLHIMTSYYANVLHDTVMRSFEMCVRPRPVQGASRQISSKTNAFVSLVIRKIQTD